jgi:hypothetical protein
LGGAIKTPGKAKFCLRKRRSWTERNIRYYAGDVTKGKNKREKLSAIGVYQKQHDSPLRHQLKKLKNSEL